ncbi:MAG: phosphatase PAP2 family protein [Polyangiaceae bacterium]|nr:phosphatase PAP2 family protein [Polyangiaceae bacterium]
MTDPVRGHVQAFLAHARTLWPKFWPAPVLPFVLFAIYQSVRGELRIDHVLLILVSAMLAYVGPRTKELLIGLYPMALVGVFYDAMRPLQSLGVTAERLHLCDLRQLELALFGFESGGQRITFHDWFVVHHAPALDLFAAVPYGTFIAACVFTAIYLYFKDRSAMRRFAMGFLVLNVLGFITYHVLPAAPPWYFHAHGCTIDLATRATEGPALSRVDAMLGISYFHGMYGRASSVFGALPSLHCAYPVLIVLIGWRHFGIVLRAASIGFACWMIFSAVYLDHHWLLDAVLGVSYAVVTALALGAIDRYRARRKHEATNKLHSAAPAAVASGGGT